MPEFVKQTLEPFLSETSLKANRRSRSPKTRKTGSGTMPLLHRPSSARGGLLFGRLRRRRSGALRAPRGTLFAPRRQLLLALDVFVEADGQVLDDRILYAEPAFNFVNQFAVIRADLEINVDAFAMLGHAVGELTGTPVLGLFDLAALFRAGDFYCVLRFLDFL